MGGVQTQLAQWQAGDWWALGAAYGLGCANAAYYLVRARTGLDIRAHGSGNAGARNAGRLLGPGGFALAFTLDAGKGVLAVLLAATLGHAALTAALSGLAAVAGHLWPVQLGGRGGKGLATSVGALGALLALGAPGLSWVGAVLGLLLLATHRHNLARAASAARQRRRARRLATRHPT